MSKEEIKDIIEILELSKEEIESNNENISATLDLQDLKSLKNLYDLYQAEKEKNKLLQDAYDKRVFEIMDLESRVEELEEENFAIKEQKKYLISTTNKDILKYWRKK